jgi:hypothetical protein
MKQTTSLAVLALVNNISATRIAHLSEVEKTHHQYESAVGK